MPDFFRNITLHRTPGKIVCFITSVQPFPELMIIRYCVMTNQSFPPVNLKTLIYFTLGTVPKWIMSLKSTPRGNSLCHASNHQWSITNKEKFAPGQHLFSFASFYWQEIPHDRLCSCLCTTSNCPFLFSNLFSQLVPFISCGLFHSYSGFTQFLQLFTK